MASPRIALCVPVLWLMLVAPGACFLAPPVLTVARSTGPAVLRGGALACRAMALGDDSSHRLARGAAIRSLASAAVVSTLALETPALAADDEEAEEEGDDSQIIDLDGINGKKLAVVLGAFVVADVISALLTGRSVLPLPIGNKGQEDWKSKVVAQLLEDEKKKSAAKMGVSVTTNTEKKEGRVSSTGDYAKTDPFEIAKEKYKKKPSIDDLKRDLSKKLDKDDEDEY